MKKKSKSICLFWVVMIAVIFVSCGEKTERMTQNETVKYEKNYVAFETNNYSLDIPADWVKKDAETHTYYANDTNFLMISEPAYDNTISGPYSDALINEVVEGLSSGLEVLKDPYIERVSLKNGIKGFYVNYEWIEGERACTMWTFSFVNQGYYNMIAFVGISEEINRYKVAYEKVLESIKLKTTVECLHRWSEATCVEAKTCTICSKTSGGALGHTTSQGICTRCGIYSGVKTWEFGELTDEFQQKTGVKYVSTHVKGTFNNSATTNSEVLAELQVTVDDVMISLAEYNYSIVKCSYGSDTYNVTMLDTNGVKHYMTGTMYEGQQKILFSEANEEIIIDALKGNGKVSFYIENAERTVTNYLFSVETSNFANAYSQL